MAEEKLPEFRMCGCGLHGRVILADGRLEMEVYSQKLARISVGVAAEHGRVALRHREGLHRQIHASGLPPTNEGTEAICRQVWDWNRRWERRQAFPAPPCLKELPT